VKRLRYEALIAKKASLQFIFTDVFIYSKRIMFMTEISCPLNRKC